MLADPPNAAWSRRSKLEIAVGEPERLVRRLIEHFAANDAEISPVTDGASATFFYSQIIMQARPNAVAIEVVAGDDVALSHMKSVAAALLIEYSDGGRPRLKWIGHGTGATSFPNFREMTVARIADVTPHMRRITLSGHNLDERYATHGQHFKLLVPPEGVDRPEWPVPGEDGLPIWPAEDKRPKVRTLTARRVDLGAGTIDVDFALHGDLGIASRWALNTRPGDIVGIRGPIGQPVPKADWYLLVGDETALPAIARTLESLPVGTRGVAIIEVSDESERQSIHHNTDIELRWLYRNGAEAGTTSLLVDEIYAVEMPPAGTMIHAAAGVEYTAFKAIRRYWRDELKLDKKQVLPVAYWRRGRAEGDTVPDDEES
ncbi:siderophore-interacting protein [Neorhizobium sp. NCHU2750]|uniref:siderophore-interacting protein n=1 Tax=Neorhizobium sp. NCHU2750 TaxID=1825976 RepID=UPI000E725F8C|nr:side tail fiber protein [Neorhizobium sp. NCHU2750]